MMRYGNGGSVVAVMVLAVAIAGFAQDALVRPHTPIVKAGVDALEADYLLISRVPASGSTDCLFVKYVVTPEEMRFFVMHSEAAFNVRFFPMRARGMAGTIGDDGIRLRQVENKFNVFRAAQDTTPVVPMRHGSVFYDPKEAVDTPLLFVPRHQLEFATRERPEASYSFEANSGRLVYQENCMADGAVDEEVVRRDGALLRRTQYVYGGESGSRQLRSLSAEIHPEVFQVENSAGIAMTAASRAYGERMLLDNSREATRLESQLKRLESVPYVHHAGGRIADVDFETRRLDEAQVHSIPVIFSIKGPMNALVSGVLREAHLLSLRPLSKADAEIRMEDGYSPEMPLVDAIVKWTGKHSSTMFRGQEVDDDVAEFRRFVADHGFSSPDAPLVDRIRVAGRNLDIEIYRHDRSEIRYWLHEYLNVVSQSPLRRFQPELVVWLLRRVDSSGTNEVYADVVSFMTGHLAASMQVDEILDSMDYTVQLGFGPFAFFHWGVTSLAKPGVFAEEPNVIISSPGPGLSPEQRFRRVFLASRILPSLRAIEASPTAGRSGFLAFDGNYCKTTFSKEEIEKTSAAILKEASAAIALMDPKSAEKARHMYSGLRSNLDPRNIVVLPNEE